MQMIESGQVIDQEDIEKIFQLNESVKGTKQYMKYQMEMSFKHDNTNTGKFTNWKFFGSGIPYLHNLEKYMNSGYIFKIVKGNVYIESFPHKDSYGTTQVERWCVNDAVMEELGWFY